MNLMKKILLLIIFANFLCMQCVANENFHKVIKIIDGDTVYIDFNDNGMAEKEEKVRINGIDTFETKTGAFLDYQIKNYNLTQNEALGLGYYSKEFAKKELLNKYVKAEYTAEGKFDKNNRHLMSIYYDCNKNGKCKNYEKEVLKAGLATIYTKSNLAKDLKSYENIEKVKQNAKKSHKLDLVVLNKKNRKYHKTNCEYAFLASQQELIKKPIVKYSPASCCHSKPKKKQNDYKSYKKIVKPDVKDGNIELYFLSPLKQKHPENNCKSSACKALLYNIDNAKESIDFAIYGIAEQDRIFDALVNAQKRGVKVRWVTDLTEKKENIYFDTYKLMKEIPSVKTDYIFHNKEIKSNNDLKYKFPYTAIMHDKFFIFDDKIVFTGSTNISSTCLTGFNSNVAVLIYSDNVAQVYNQEFEQMYSGNFHTDKKPVKNNENIRINDLDVSIYFSPANKITIEKIVPLIKNSKNYIYIPAFYITHPILIKELVAAKQKGVDVKVIVDETSVKGEYVNINYLKQKGIDLKVENWAGKMHMKSIIIDDDVMVIGSMNFTKQGENRNDENTIIIKSSKVLTAKYKEHFLKLWDSIK